MYCYISGMLQVCIRIYLKSGLKCIFFFLILDTCDPVTRIRANSSKPKGAREQTSLEHWLSGIAGLITEEDTFKRKAAVKCPWPTH